MQSLREFEFVALFNNQSPPLSGKVTLSRF